MDAGDRWLLGSLYHHFGPAAGRPFDMARRNPRRLVGRVAPGENCPRPLMDAHRGNHRLPTRLAKASNFAIFPARPSANGGYLEIDRLAASRQRERLVPGLASLTLEVVRVGGL